MNNNFMDGSYIQLSIKDGEKHFDLGIVLDQVTKDKYDQTVLRLARLVWERYNHD